MPTTCSQKKVRKQGVMSVIRRWYACIWLAGSILTSIACCSRCPGKYLIGPGKFICNQIIEKLERYLLASMMVLIGDNGMKQSIV